MKKDDAIKQAWFPALKGANRDLIRECGGIARVAEFLDVSIGLVGAWNSWDACDLMPSYYVMALESERGKPVVSASMAAWTGARLGLVEIAPGAGVAVEVAAVTQEFSELLSLHAAAAADGRYSLSELRQLRAQAQDLIRQAKSFIATGDSVMGQMASGEG